MISTLIFTVFCLIATVAMAKSNRKTKKNDIRIDLIEKTNLVLAENYDSISDKYETLNRKFETTISKNEDLIKSNTELQDRCNKLITLNETLIKNNNDLESRVTKLEDENKKIISTLQQYNMMAPNFELKQPFVMKIVK